MQQQQPSQIVGSAGEMLYTFLKLIVIYEYLVHAKFVAKLVMYKTCSVVWLSTSGGFSLLDRFEVEYTSSADN